ncbi:MAG TPA: ATP F0F1 synthase subunit B [Paracoccaceae bacterium]|nr:ATP F0F1 synthase subunit B [Paracoccaceae bacterium]
MSIWYNSDFTVGIAFVLFLVILWYFGVHKIIFRGLDDRALKIRSELEEARRLAEEAQELFADFERRQKQVGELADEIVAKARDEAEQAAARAKAELDISIERRLKAADEQIAQAEATAIREVKDRAIAVAIAATTEILRDRLGEERQQDLIDNAIEDLGQRLH